MSCLLMQRFNATNRFRFNAFAKASGIPDKYAETLRELIRAKIEQLAPQIEVATECKAPKEVVNIMAALKESMQAKGRAKVRDAVGRRIGKPSKKEEARLTASRQAHAGRRIEKASALPQVLQ
jgi:DNA phosphorothioation-dependent restriction protein DptG